MSDLGYPLHPKGLYGWKGNYMEYLKPLHRSHDHRVLLKLSNNFALSERQHLYYIHYSVEESRQLVHFKGDPDSDLSSHPAGE